MQVQLWGAAGEVTGSAYLVTTRSARLLVDCGMFQGEGAGPKNRLPPGLQPKKLDAVVLTHGHLDHTGRLPLLWKAGFRNRIHTTPATVRMTELVLHDAAHLQESDAELANRRRQRAGRPLVQPLFTAADVEQLKPLFSGLPFGESREVAPGVTARLVEAGHMLGAASVELTIEEDGTSKKAVFSGDLGPHDYPPLRGPVTPGPANLVFSESTYGDRDHQPLSKTLADFRDILHQAIAAKAKVLIPTFAIGRAQQLLYHVAALFRTGAVPAVPVYFDSPMAIEATQIYREFPQLLDAEARQLLESGELQKDLHTMQICRTADESKALNNKPGPCLILAGSGMCNDGRILHHLKHNLWRPETAVLFVGYQAAGTLGRMLVEGQKSVKIYGESVAVKAAIHTLGGFSAHAGQTELLGWLAPLAANRPRVVLTHGEPPARVALAAKIAERFGLTAEQPNLGDTVEV